MEKVDENYLNERFEAFIEKNSIDTSNLSEGVLFILQTGYRYVLAKTENLESEEVSL